MPICKITIKKVIHLYILEIQTVWFNISFLKTVEDYKCSINESNLIRNDCDIFIFLSDCNIFVNANTQTTKRLFHESLRIEHDVAAVYFSA